MHDQQIALGDARETAVLSAIIVNPDLLDSMSWLSPDAFRDERNAMIFATVRTRRGRGEPIDVVHIAESFNRSGALAEKLGVDAIPYLTSLTIGVPTADPVGHAKQIQQEAQRQRLKLTLDSIKIAVDDPAHSVDFLARQLIAAADGIVDQRSEIASITSAELDAGDFNQVYLVENVLVAGQPCIIGGPKKALKTNSTIDLALSLASGAKFLNSFYVTKPVRVAIISGESGAATIQETARRVARSKPWHNLRDYENLRWSFDLPQLTDPVAVLALRQFIRRHRVEVVILDPAYLCLNLGDDAGNLFKAGAALMPLSRMAQDEGVTPIILHHLVKSVSVTDAPPELESLAWAGFCEWARQWILISRRAAFDPDRSGHHELWLSAGGSAGHSVGKAVDIEEGDRRDEGGRRWDVTVKPIGEAIGEKIEAAESAKENRQNAQNARQREKDVEAVTAALKEKPSGMTERDLRSFVKQSRLKALLAELVRTKVVAPCFVMAANKQEYDGFRLPSETLETPETISSDSGDTIGYGDGSPLIGGTVSSVCVPASEARTDSSDANGKKPKRQRKAKAKVEMAEA